MYKCDGGVEEDQAKIKVKRRKKKKKKTACCNSATPANAEESVALVVEVALFNPLFISAKNKQVDS